MTAAPDSRVQRDPPTIRDMESVVSLLAKWSRRVGPTGAGELTRPREPAVDTERRLVRRLKAHFQGNGHAP